MKKLITALASSFLIFCSCSADEKVADAPAAPANGKSKDTVVMSTTMGDITIKFMPEKAPMTVANFMRYVDEKHYDGTVFHRVIPGFMIQGGGFAPDGGALVQRETKAPIMLEADNGLLNERGTIAMARTNVRDSATSQFFINVKHNTSLDGAYAVFGEVTKGMDVVDKIIAVQTKRRNLTSLRNGQKIEGPAGDVPVENVIINWVRRAE